MCGGIGRHGRFRFYWIDLIFTAVKLTNKKIMEMTNMAGFDIYDREICIMKVRWGNKVGYATTENTIGERHIKINRGLYGRNFERVAEVPFENVTKFLESRTVPRTRYDLESVLKKYNVKFYDPLNMCKKSHGVSMSDYIWIKFIGEELTFNDVKLRD